MATSSFDYGHKAGTLLESTKIGFTIPLEVYDQRGDMSYPDAYILESSESFGVVTHLAGYAPDFYFYCILAQRFLSQLQKRQPSSSFLRQDCIAVYHHKVSAEKRGSKDDYR